MSPQGSGKILVRRIRQIPCNYKVLARFWELPENGGGGSQGPGKLSTWRMLYMEKESEGPGKVAEAHCSLWGASYDFGKVWVARGLQKGKELPGFSKVPGVR